MQILEHILKIRREKEKHEFSQTVGNHLTDKVVSVDQCAGTTSVQEQQRVINLGDEGKLVLPTTPIASQVLESTTIPEEQSNLWPPNIVEPGQATAWVEEIILLDPP